MIYTIFAIYPDNEQRHCAVIEAGSPEDAENKYREEMDHGNPMLIAATVEGECTPVDGKMFCYE